jgi:hypothetical protein
MKKETSATKNAHNGTRKNHEDTIMAIDNAIELQVRALKTVTKVILATIDQHTESADMGVGPAPSMQKRAVRHLARVRFDLQVARDELQIALLGLRASKSDAEARS